jgi:hypothetical protein
VEAPGRKWESSLNVGWLVDWSNRQTHSTEIIWDDILNYVSILLAKLKVSAFCSIEIVNVLSLTGFSATYLKC